MQDVIAEIRPTSRFPEFSSELTSSHRRWRHATALRLASCLRVLGTRQRNAFGILTYHRVSADVLRDDAMLNVHPERFHRQIEGLLALGYQPWSLRRLVDLHQSGDAIPPKTYAVVFDDGYHDVYQHAWPVLRRHHVPATVFLATAYLDSKSPFPFDDWSSDISDSRPLSTEECCEMQAGGLVELGSHTHTHADFRGRAVEFNDDLRRSLDILYGRFCVEVPPFSFPYGFADHALTEVAREVGVSCSLTAECELVTSDTDLFSWGRFGGTNFDTPHSLAAKLDGWYSLCRDVKQSLGRRRRNG